MFDNNNNNNKLKDEKNELNISFFNFMNYFSKIQPNIYEELSNNKKSLSLYLQYSEKIISIIINDNIIKTNKILDNKIKARNIKYIINILKNKNIKLKYKSSFNSSQKIINYIFITFIYNLFIQFLLNKKNKDSIKRRKVHFILNNLLNNILFIIGKLYIDTIINDDFFEMILRLLLIFTTSKSENESNEKDEIIHLMFMKSCFNLIKNVFNYLLLIQNKYTSVQEILINKIIIFMKDNIINFNDNSKRIAYINKVFLSKYESKTLLLIDLYSIISKIKSETIFNNFIDLLANIYYFKYENVRRPMMRQLEPLFININKKNIKQLENDINLSDFSISLINSLIKKEDDILKEHSCLIKQGFYFGNDISGLVCDINSLENEFIILLGFMIEPTKMFEITLFNIINNKDKSTELKLFLRKSKENNYELFAESKKISESTTKIYIECNRYYILSINFKIGGLFQSSSMKIYYIKDNNILENEKKKMKNGKELKIKNFKNENISICFGCDINSKDPDKIINKFRGFIGDIIILNTKNIKNNNIDSFHELLLSLKGNYKDILYIIGETQNNNIFLNCFNNNNNIKDKIINFSEKENKLLDDIKAIISSNLFQLIDYQDDIDNIKYNKNDLNENNEICIKKKYSEFKIKSEALDESMIKIYTNIFDKNFHIFKNEFTITEFIKYDGINYLSLLLEYYYQILSHLCVIKNDNNEKDIEYICHKIEKKILKILNFFYDNIKLNKIINTNYEEINKFYYEITITLLKYMELNSLDLDIIICLLNLLDGLDFDSQNIDVIDSIKTNLFDFLLNPKIYKKKGENQIIKLNEVFKHLCFIIKNNSNNDSQFIKNINSEEYLNKILSFIWIFDYNNNINLEKNNISIYNENGQDYLLQSTKKYYSKLLINFLISTAFKNPKINYNRNFSQKIESIFIPDNKNDLGIKASKTEKLDMNEKNNIKLVTFFFDKTLEYNNTNIYIFSNMCSVLLNSNLLDFIDESRIDKIKTILLKTSQRSMNYEHKQLKLISCLKILLGFYYYFNKSDKSKQIINKNKDQIFNTFIKNMNLSLDFFYALISSLKLINCFSNSMNDQDELTVEKIISNINNNQIKKENQEKDNNYNISLIPLQEINLEILKNLNHIQIHIIKIIFEDIVYLLKNESKNKNDNKNTNFEEIYITLKQNIDFIFRFKETKIYQEIFSSETDICAEFFYLKWKLGNNDDVDYVLCAIAKYHKDLLKCHLNPFIFKFYLYILYTENMSQTENTKITLLTLIVETLDKYKNDLKRKKEKDKNQNHIYLINNILNFLVLLNEELETSTITTQNNQLNIFNKKNFISIFYKYITLLEMSSLMYSNYYIETDDNIGKIISEVIFDIFFMIPDFNREDFMNIFTRDNIFTVFYLIDICKENILENEKKIYKKIKNYIDIDNLKYIHRNYFGRKMTSKIKLILDRKVCPIERVNFSIYFLGKGFVYLKEKKYININKGKIYNLLKENFLPLLTQNMFRLYTGASNFYGIKNCQKFPLYYETKKFFETFMIQNPKDFKKYVDYFKTDMILNLKEEYDIKYCYSSRLINEKITVINIIKKTVDQISNTCVDDVNENDVNNINDNINEINDNLNTEGKIKNDNISRINTFRLTNLIFLDDFEDFSISKNMISNIEVKESNKSLEYLNELEEKNIEYFTSSELIIKGNNIYNPKNYFLKIIFAEIYKNITFNDKAFKLIKSTYLSKYRNYNVHKESKQINYPIKQKNFSNSVEPKIFMRRDYNFYDENYIKVSHSYLKKDILNKEIENIFFYPHEYKIKMQKKEIYSLFCELVTPLYVYFGKMYFLEDYMFFETEKEDIRDIDKSVETFIKFFISNASKDNKALKSKSILIFNNDINEIIQRRTLFSPQSIEIFHKNGKSYFFNFFSVENINKVYNFLNEINKNQTLFNFNTNNNEENIKNLKNYFHKGKISNYEYILYLNKYATRTYNDLSQYPVFPWLILEYSRMTEILGLLEKKETKENTFRNMNYPISMQTEQNRKHGKTTFEVELKEENEFPFHLGTHYSNPAYINYYLIRINPYEQNIIKLQVDKYDVPERLFNNFSEIEKIIAEGNDSREIIPDFFCYFDFLCNLNCSFFGKKKSDNSIVDDFDIINKDYSQYINIISIYANSLYNNEKLLNDIYISRILSDWVDIIFGKKQLPKEDERYESYNIYNEKCYEQNVNLEEEIKSYCEKYQDNELKKKIKNEIQEKKDYLLNFGMNVKQILKNTITYDIKEKTFVPIYKVNKTNDDKYIYFNKIENNNFVIIKDEKKNKIKNRIAITYDKIDKKFNEKDCQIYDCKSMNLMKYKNDHTKNKENIYLYRVDYAFSFIFLLIEKSINTVFLSCRYLENYFRIQCQDRILNIFYEDFVTCIKGRNLTPIKDDIFYTGLLNGKLTEWKIIPFIDNLDKNKNYKLKCIYNFEIKEMKKVYAHQSSITAIEIYPNQNIIITSGEDKFIYIRKIFDFELLTVIDLTYTFGNPIISQAINIFPSLIKVSELNLLYVLFYDYDSKKTFIRGYNLNGLFFAQTDPLYFKDNKLNLQFNSISFTKNSNLIVGFYNTNKFYVLRASNLAVLWIKEIMNEEDKIKKNGTKMVEYNYNNREFYFLYEDEFIITTLQEKDGLKEFDSF